MKKSSIAATLVAAAALACAGSAQAQAAGSMSLKLGLNKVTPHVTSDDLSAPALPGSKIDVKSATSVILTATYQWTDEISLEFFGGLPYKHDIVGAGAVAGVGKLGTIQQVSPTLLAQYRFLGTDATVRPYVGGGFTYAMFYGGEGSGALTAMTNPGGQPTLIGSDKSFGFTWQLGTTVRIDKQWYADIGMLKTYISSTTPLVTQPSNNGQTVHAKLDPVSVNFSVGYRF